MNPLSNEEAWDLFKQQRGQGFPFSQDVEEIARDIINECDCLPIGIIAVARSTTRFFRKRQWKNALRNLRQSRVGLHHMEKADRKSVV